mmetsp:Transcript_18350/g.42314  ORF Transcript_18350/g.42314 Transcript_18350/m.42314 type:complete len:222 (+) Transcript_18350:794-1459(+)
MVVAALPTFSVSTPSIPASFVVAVVERVSRSRQSMVLRPLVSLSVLFFAILFGSSQRFTLFSLSCRSASKRRSALSDFALGIPLVSASRISRRSFFNRFMLSCRPVTSIKSTATTAANLRRLFGRGAVFLLVSIFSPSPRELDSFTRYRAGTATQYTSCQKRSAFERVLTCGKSHVREFRILLRVSVVSASTKPPVSIFDDTFENSANEIHSLFGRPFFSS